MTDRNLTELEHMAQDPELSTPRKEAAVWALAEIARLQADLAAAVAAKEKMQRSRDRYRESWEAEKRRFTDARAALPEAKGE